MGGRNNKMVKKYGEGREGAGVQFIITYLSLCRSFISKQKASTQLLNL